MSEQAEVQDLCSSSGVACQRAVYASLSTAKVFAVAKWEPRPPTLSRHDGREVDETQTFHTSAQCRLDTFVAGWFCPQSHRTPFDDRNPKIGACNAEDAHPSDGFKRPSCWYL